MQHRCLVENRQTRISSLTAAFTRRRFAAPGRTSERVDVDERQQYSGATPVYGTKGVPAAGNVPGARDYAVAWADSSGNLWLFGG